MSIADLGGIVVAECNAIDTWQAGGERELIHLGD